MALTSELMLPLLPVSSDQKIWLLLHFSWIFPTVQIQLKSQYFKKTIKKKKKKIFCDLSLQVELQTPGVVPNVTECVKIFEEVRARPPPYISRHGTHSWQTR